MPSPLYRAFLLCYPAAFRQEYGGDMELAFGEQLDEARNGGGCLAEAALWFEAARDAATVGPKEHAHVIFQDLKYAWRTTCANPGFAIVAILSLAVGIGANTAIFSVWSRLLGSSLPVAEPDRLVALTDPGASGIWVGSSEGERELMTYAEFEQLRDRADGFAGMMAFESSLGRWPARFDSAAPAEVRGRLVSGGYFEVLGVRPLLGRLFTAEDDRRGAPFAVLSHGYWQRLGGRPDILGKPIAIRRAALTVIGVTPPHFTGETPGQQPDLWIAMRNQPRLIPGQNRLVDEGPNKIMWLQVFGRLKPGVTEAQAQAAANAVFKNGLKDYYGAVLSPEKAREYADQRLTVRSAAHGMTSVSDDFADPLRILMAAVGVVLLIACCNLANLLLARGAARQHEIALRLSLGASRGRLIRQLITESAVLAMAGGAAGLGLAYVLNRALVHLLGGTESTLRLAFGLDPSLLLFGLAVTAGATIAFAALPAFLATRGRAVEAFQGHGRNTSASAGQLRWGRAFVALQLALSLPLLAGAGLLVRTLANLRNVDLGYEREHLAVARVGFGIAGYDEARRAPAMRRLLDDIARLPDVKSASYSENGLFTGHDSADEIEVEGFTPKSEDEAAARWDHVGPKYFTAVGVPILLGREIDERDHAAAPRACVINESFARKFFAGRSPIGMAITTVDGDKRSTHRVVGVAADFRPNGLRDKIDPRYFVPDSQPLTGIDRAVFIARTGGNPARALAGIRETVRRADPMLEIDHLDVLEDRVDRRIAGDRVIAILTAGFGVAGILLSAIGLYGVLAYGVTRRRIEIGIRIALGAEPVRVIGMILREAGATLAVGLLIGAGLAWAGTSLIASRVFGVSPADPATLGGALTVLVAVALAAAYLPARRASRMEPMVALRQE